MDTVSEDHRYTETETETNTETETETIRKTERETLERYSLLKSAKISKGEAVTSVAGLRNEEASRADVGALPPAAGHVTEDFRSERRPAPQISASPKRWQLARERERQGLIVLQIVVGDAHVSALLTGAGYLDPLKADDKKAIARALERYIAAGRVAEFDV